MDSTPKSSAKDFILHLGAVVALYTSVVSLLDLLFTVVNSAWPQVNAYNYYSSASISFPISTLIIFFPAYLLLMWLLEKSYASDPAKRNLGVKKWLTYITLFIAGLTMAIDLVVVLRAFLSGNDLTLAFLLKVLAVFVVAGLAFYYYIEDVRSRLTAHKRTSWMLLALVIVIASITWGFSVLGSPRTQRLLNYDQEKLNDVQNINQAVISFYETVGYIPSVLSELASTSPYFTTPNDPQSGLPYEYHLIGQSAKAYEICADFNKASADNQIALQTYPVQYPGGTWTHPAGTYCFELSIPVSMYKSVPTGQ